MTKMDRDDAFNTLTSDELKTLVKVLESPNRQIYVYLVSVDDVESAGPGKITLGGIMHRHFSDRLSLNQTQLVLTAFEREVLHLKEILENG